MEGIFFYIGWFYIGYSISVDVSYGVAVIKGCYLVFLFRVVKFYIGDASIV